MSRPYEPFDFPALLEKYADYRPLGCSRWSTRSEQNRAVPDREDVIRERLANRYRNTYQDRAQNYSLRESEIFTLAELGKFSVISAEVLKHFADDGNQDRLEQDFQNLRNQSLISHRELEAQNNPNFRVLSLTIRFRAEGDVS